MENNKSTDRVILPLTNAGTRLELARGFTEAMLSNHNIDPSILDAESLVEAAFQVTEVFLDKLSANQNVQDEFIAEVKKHYENKAKDTNN